MAFTLMPPSIGASSTRGPTKVVVTLYGATKIVIPIDPSTTVSELQSEASRRAHILKLPTPPGELVLRLESEDGPIAFPEDNILDILEGDDIWLGPISKGELSTLESDLIYVRWITPGQALDFPTLSAIPPDKNPINRRTSIHSLRDIAADRIYRAPASNEAPTISNFRVELSLTACALRTTDEETSLASLGCAGSLEQPLDIFVFPTSKASADEDRPQDLWGFESSERGIATFQTCLKVVMAEATKRPILSRLLKTLFKVTHFPPALEALQVLGAENKFVPSAVATLATCFRELALRMVPGEHVNGNARSILEGSRQIFAWMDSEYRGLPDEVDDPEAALVRNVTFEEMKEETEQNDYRPGKKCEIVEFEAGGDPMESSSASLQRSKRKIKVWTQSNCRENAHLLALAMWGRYNGIEDYYIDFRDAIDRPLDHKRTPICKEFSLLLASANANQRFRMTAPNDLDETFGTAITLSKEGYVSIYGMNAGYFKDLQPSTWNAITGTDLLDTNPGQSLLQTLQPVIKQRKLEGTWEVDEWEHASAPALDFASPQEAIVICFDLSYSMDDSLGESWIGAPNGLRKLDEAKQVFENVIARMVGYHMVSNYVGVVTFSSRNAVDISMELSRLSKEFKSMMGNKGANGCTALWDALKKGKDMLVAFKSKHPKTKLRIIALTDGEDNESKTKPDELCKELYDAEVVLDSIVIGSSSTTDLFKMSKHTGGYAFCPTSRLLLFQTFLLEPFLDISARPDIERVPITFYSTSAPKKPDMKSTYDFPPCRPHPLESGSFVSLNDVGRYFPTRSTTPGQTRTSTLAAGLIPDRGRLSSTAYSSASTLVSRNRLSSGTLSVSSDGSAMSLGKVCLNEISFLRSNEHRYLDAYVNETAMSFWQVAMEGPPSSPYEGGTFVLTVHMTETFPQTPPMVRFVTPILHPNITKHGRVCHAIFAKGWKPSYHIHTVLQYMYDLLKNPETDDAVDELATLKFWTDQNTANNEIRKYVSYPCRDTSISALISLELLGRPVCQALEK
ncbi:hypothetical protein FGG08_004884 [Glutinoglossum americanum]|uniref:UBC core domain-containing protein n=1 Tax=Glutinoglossum americanum TaxID=1670608 RepID=A0A9P8HZD3_9PEZI|nr:hypothetical protein FGG08_004884 [Glutinoglossum americanum]